jgi:hypothetical protein
MQSLSSDIAITFLWLALSAAAMLAGVLARIRHMGRWAWPAVIGGVGLLAWSANYVHPTLLLRQPGSSIPELQQDLAAERARHAETRRLLEAAQRERDDHARRVAELDTEVAAEKGRHAETKGRLEAAAEAARRDREQYEQRLASANTELAGERSLHAETKRLLEAAQRDRDNLAKQAAGLRTELSAERGLHAETRRLLEAAQRDRDNLAKRVAELSTELAAEKARHAEPKPTGYAGALYSAALLSDAELVAGKRGTYHAIRLFSPARESIPIFDLGSYRLASTRQQEVANAIAELDREVVRVLSPSKTVAILIRGRANNIAFRTPGTLLPDLCPGNSISYVPYDESEKRYKSEVTQQVLAGTYTNRELPNLRAASIACIAHANMPSVELIILQGEISPTTDRSALTADMFLFTAASARATSR